MFTRIGLIMLFLFLVETLAAICAQDSEARPFRRFAQFPSNRGYYSTTNRGTTQAGVVQHTTAKPMIPDAGQELKQTLTPNTELQIQQNTNEKRKSAVVPVSRKGFSEYDLLGLDFSEQIEALPLQERETMQEVTANPEEIYKERILKKYPEVRPEVAESLALIAEAVHKQKGKPEIGKLVREMPVATRQLKPQEVLAVNNELAPEVDPEEFKAISALNNYRMRSGLRPCVIDLLLVLVSRGHSSDMMRYGFFSHNSPVSGKGNFQQRAGQYGASASAENIYMGSSSGQAANNAWANSSGHRANMLGGFSRVGVGRIGGYFTQMFGM